MISFKSKESVMGVDYRHITVYVDNTTVNLGNVSKRDLGDMLDTLTEELSGLLKELDE
jgi:hypothetical protein